MWHRMLETRFLPLHATSMTNKKQSVMNDRRRFRSCFESAFVRIVVEYGYLGLPTWLPETHHIGLSNQRTLLLFVAIPGLPTGLSETQHNGP